MNAAPKVALLFAAAATLWGCAGNAERHAFRQWIDADRAHDAAPPSHPTAPPPDALAPNADFAAALAFAERHNPALLAAQQDWKSALEKIPQARALPDPQLMYQHNGLMHQDEFGVGQTVPWPAKLDHRAAVAVQGARAAHARYLAHRLALAARLADAWADYAYLAHSIELTAQNAALARTVADAAQARVRAARANTADLLRAQVEADRIDNDLSTLRLALRPALATINALLGRPAATPLAAPAALAAAPLSLTDDQLAAALTQNSPELAALADDVARARAAIAAAKSEQYPDTSVQLLYQRDNTDREAVGVGLGVTVPIYREKYDALRLQSLADFSAAVHRRADRSNALAQQLQTALFHLRDAQRRIALFHDRLIPKSRDTLSATLAAYRSDRATLSDVLLVQRDLLDLQLSEQRAIADRFARLAELRTLIGQSPVTSAGAAP